MARRLLPTGPRGRLVAAIVVVTAIVLAGSFFALHRTTGADLNRQIDDQLQGDASEFAASPAVDAKTEGSSSWPRARAFLAGQGYHADSRVFAIQVGRSPRDVVTNQREAVVPEDEEGTSRRWSTARTRRGASSHTARALNHRCAGRRQAASP